MTIWFPASATSKSEIPQDKRAEKVCSYLADFWFIPTHAGNTLRLCVRRERYSVHPHSRGEHLEGQLLDRLNLGSSPLTRGTLLSRLDHTDPGRFIPTHAGNTSAPHAPGDIPPVHPHSRGEHVYGFAGAAFAPGSSPLTRGTRLRLRYRERRPRFIPTHAGNTVGGFYAHNEQPVHPHSRGEHSISPCGAPRGSGSSPLTRGTRCCG